MDDWPRMTQPFFLAPVVSGIWSSSLSPKRETAPDTHHITVTTGEQFTSDRGPACVAQHLEQHLGSALDAPPADSKRHFAELILSR